MNPQPSFTPDEERLRHREEAIEPELSIVDSHHHLWDRPAHGSASYYTVRELDADMRGGHDITATVFVECGSHYRETGPGELRAVGETEWVAGLPREVNELAGIIGFADIRLGVEIGTVLDGHREVASDRFRGIRFIASWDDSPQISNNSHGAPAGTLVSDEAVAAVRTIGERGLLFETMCYYHQLDELAVLARSAPDTTIVVDHLGGPLGAGPYATRRDEVRAAWMTGISALALEPNVVMKLGGLGCGPYIELDVANRLNSSDDIAEYWAPEVLHCIEQFGADRCMAESNFPVDSRLCDYVTLWNSLKKITKGVTPSDREAIFAGTARRTYELN